MTSGDMINYEILIHLRSYKCENFIYFWNEKRIIKKERPEKPASKLREKNFDYNFALTDEKIIP